MKYLILFAATAALMFGQEAKVAVPPSSIPTVTERALSELEVTKLQLSIAQIELLQKKYDIEKYQAELKPHLDAQQAIVGAACKSVGVAEDKITTDCGLSTGIGQDGKPAMGADGKPVQARVWHATPPVTEKK